MATLASVPASIQQPSLRKLGIAWVLLCLSLALHVVDEAANGFLYIYNPTVIALREIVQGYFFQLSIDIGAVFHHQASAAARAIHTLFPPHLPSLKPSMPPPALRLPWARRTS